MPEHVTNEKSAPEVQGAGSQGKEESAASRVDREKLIREMRDGGVDERDLRDRKWVDAVKEDLERDLEAKKK